MTGTLVAGGLGIVLVTTGNTDGTHRSSAELA
jgi:hypothetical protein